MISYGCVKKLRVNTLACRNINNNIDVYLHNLESQCQVYSIRPHVEQ